MGDDMSGGMYVAINEYTRGLMKYPTTYDVTIAIKVINRLYVTRSIATYYFYNNGDVVYS